MAPKKRTAKQEDEPAAAAAAAAAAAKPAPTSSRVTRSSARLAANSKAGGPVPELPVRKKPKRAQKENGKPEAEEVETEKEEVEVGAASEKLGGEDAMNRTVVIEHCKQCQSFKKRAIEVQNGLETGVPGITVLVNPDKPRRGCFEIRSGGGEKFISLLDMKRPFTRMKELDMGKVISNIVEKIKG